MNISEEFSYMINTGVVNMDHERQEICKLLKDKFHITVSYLTYEIGPCQASLKLYVSNCGKEFLDIIISSGGVFNRIDYNSLSPTYFPKTYNYLLNLDKQFISPINDDIISESALKLAHNVIDEYYAFTKKQSDVITYAEFYSFEKSVLEYVYGLSFGAIRDTLIDKTKEIKFKNINNNF